MSSNIRSKTTRVGKLDIHYFSGGEGDPLVIIHGGADGAASWLQNATELSQHHKVYVPDLPGFGRSQSTDDEFDLSELARFIEGFSQSLGLKRFHLLGHSLGGGIALHYALKFPHRIERLILVSSMCLGKEIALWARCLSSPAFINTVGEVGLAIFKAVRWLIRSFYAPFEFVNPPSRMKMEIGKSVLSLKGQTTVLLNRLSELLIPTLVVWGSNDTILPVAHAHAASQVIPACQLHIFDDCGHSVYKETGPEFSHLLVKFLDKREHSLVLRV